MGSSRDPEFKAFLASNAYRLAIDEPTFAEGLRLAGKIAETTYKGRPLGRFGASPFVFIAAETSEPHSISTFEAGTTFLENGVTKLQSCLATFKACSQTGYWPDLSCTTTLEISPWQQYSARQEWRSGLESVEGC